MAGQTIKTLANDVAHYSKGFCMHKNQAHALSQKCLELSEECQRFPKLQGSHHEAKVQDVLARAVDCTQRWSKRCWCRQWISKHKMVREITMVFNEGCATLQVLKEDVGRFRVPLDVLLPALQTHSSLSLLQAELGASSTPIIEKTIMTYQTPPPLTPVLKPAPLPSPSPNRPLEGSVTVPSSSSRTSLTDVAHRASAPPSNCSLSQSSTQAPSPLALPAHSLPPVPDHTPCNSLLFSSSELPSLPRSTSPPSITPSTSDMSAQSSDSQDGQATSRQKPRLRITIPA